MKLRNKKTGEIRELPDGFFCGDNLKKICEEWEDYEEPKDHWHIGCEGDVFIDNTESYLKIYSSIGNDFATKEEAKKAVEKLKAWKRLKDKGFRFGKWYWDDTQGHYILEEINFVMDEYDGAEADIDLLFGGEE